MHNVQSYTEFLQTVADSVNSNIDSVISWLGLEVAWDNGTEYQMNCPWHSSESGKSYTYNSGKGMFKCFGCVDGYGDGVDFIEYSRFGTRGDKINRDTALREYCSRFGIQMYEYKKTEKSAELSEIQKDLLFYINMCHKNMPPIISVLLKKKWGLTDETLKMYRIGFCDQKLIDTIAELAPKVIESLKTLRLVHNSGKISRNNWITFPILVHGVPTNIAHRMVTGLLDDIVSYHNGEAVHVVKNEDSELEIDTNCEAKFGFMCNYESAHINHGFLYGVDALPVGYNSIIVCEGFCDAPALVQNGLPAVAFGTLKPSADMMKHIKYVTKNVNDIYVCLDSDDGAGQDYKTKCAVRIKELNVNKNVYILDLPKDGDDKIDPAEFFKSKTVDDMKKLIENSVEITDVIIDKIGDDFNWEKYDKDEGIKLLQTIYVNLENKIKKENIEKSIKDKSGYSAKVVRDILNNKDMKCEPEEDEDEKIPTPIIRANNFLNEFIVKYSPVEGFYLYVENRYFRKVHDSYIGTLINEVHNGALTGQMIKQVIDTLKVTPEVNVGDIMEKPNHDYVNVINGMLHIYTRELFPHDPKYLSVNPIPVKYDKDAPTDKWMKFLNEIHPHPEDILTLQEHYGLGLTVGVENIMVFGIGDGANGKTTESETVCEIYGEENVSYLLIHELEEKFKLPHIKNKLFNLGADVSNKELMETKNIKRILDGNKVTAENKGKDAFVFRPTCTFKFDMNELPPMNDLSYGYERRIIIVEYPNTFKGTKANKNLKEELKEELSGILNWMLDGLERLRVNKVYTESKNSKLLKGLYMKKSNAIRQFIDDVLIECNKKDSISKQFLYQIYDKWCTLTGRRGKKNENNFFESLYKELGVDKDEVTVRPRIDGMQIRSISGIKFNPVWDEIAREILDYGTDRLHGNILRSRYMEIVNRYDEWENDSTEKSEPDTTIEKPSALPTLEEPFQIFDDDDPFGDIDGLEDLD